MAPQKASITLAGFAWSIFKLGFGLLSLATTWATVAWTNGVFQPSDTDEEKQELEKGRQSGQI